MENKTENGYVVYMHTNKINNKKYIGISKNYERRWSCGYGYVNNIQFYKDIEQYGWDGFEHTIIENDLCKVDALIVESRLIKQYKTDNIEFGYNTQTFTKYDEDDDNSVTLTLRIPRKMKERLMFIADTQYRTLNKLMFKICDEFIEEFNNLDIET